MPISAINLREEHKHQSSNLFIELLQLTSVTDAVACAAADEAEEEEEVKKTRKKWRGLLWWEGASGSNSECYWWCLCLRQCSRRNETGKWKMLHERRREMEIEWIVVTIAVSDVLRRRFAMWVCGGRRGRYARRVKWGKEVRRVGRNEWGILGIMELDNDGTGEGGKDWMSECSKYERSYRKNERTNEYVNERLANERSREAGNEGRMEVVTKGTSDWGKQGRWFTNWDRIQLMINIMLMSNHNKSYHDFLISSCLQNLYSKINFIIKLKIHHSNWIGKTNFRATLSLQFQKF